jgi:hypothetical protein
MIKDWLQRITATETPPDSIVAFNVGLLQTEAGFAVYLVGAAGYDPDDDDWACDEAFTPAERYCPLAMDPAGATDWQSVQTAVADEVRDFLASPEGRASYLATAQVVTVGFDDGDLLRVG